MSVESGAWEIGKQMVSAIPRIMVILMILTFVMVPIGCYIHRKVDVSGVKAMFVSELLLECVQSFGLDKDKIEKCFNVNSKEIVFRVKSVNKSLCNDEVEYKLFNAYFNDKEYVKRTFSKIINKQEVDFNIILRR